VWKLIQRSSQWSALSALSYLYSIWHTLVSNITRMCLCNGWKVCITYTIVSLPGCHLPCKTCSFNVYCHVSQHECNSLPRELVACQHCFNNHVLITYHIKAAISCWNTLSILCLLEMSYHFTLLWHNYSSKYEQITCKMILDGISMRCKLLSSISSKLLSSISSKYFQNTTE